MTQLEIANLILFYSGFLFGWALGDLRVSVSLMVVAYTLKVWKP